MNKQIEEKSCKECVHYEVCRFVNALAVANVVNAKSCRMFKDTNDYRNASDVAREIFEEIETSLSIATFKGSDVYYAIRAEDYLHYKKKYESEGAGDEN